MIGTHVVNVYPDPAAEAPTGTPVDMTCLVDEVAINHGRSDSESQPEASSATLDVTIGPGTPLPAEVDIGAWVQVQTTLAGVTFVRFVGRVTDIAIGWDDAGEDTPEAGVGQIVATGRLADFARRIVGDEPWTQELDGARVARVFSLAGYTINPALSDPGTVQIIPRDVDAQPALGVAQGTADSAGGLVWVTRAGEIRYADAMHRRGIDVALDLDVCDVLVTPTWLRNLDGLVNTIRVSYGVGGTSLYADVNQSSVDRFGRWEFSTTVELANQTDAAALAHLILTQNGTPSWLLQSLPVDVAGLTVAETQALLALELHSLIRVGGFPQTGSTPDAISAWIEGWTERLAWGTHEITLIVSDYCRTSPPPRWNDQRPEVTWDNVGSLTWDQAACMGPVPNLGTWDTVSASVRWDLVDPGMSWNDAGAGVRAVAADAFISA